MTEQSRWRGLLVERNRSGLWCALKPWKPGQVLGRTFCGRDTLGVTAATSDQPPTCPKCLQAMEIGDEDKE